MLGPEKFGISKLEEVSRFLRPEDLLHCNFSSLNLTEKLEQLIMYSKTNSTWSKHCAAWSLLN